MYRKRVRHLRIPDLAEIMEYGGLIESSGRTVIKTAHTTVDTLEYGPVEDLPVVPNLVKWLRPRKLICKCFMFDRVFDPTNPPLPGLVELEITDEILDLEWPSRDTPLPTQELTHLYLKEGLPTTLNGEVFPKLSHLAFHTSPSLWNYIGDQPVFGQLTRLVLMVEEPEVQSRDQWWQDWNETNVSTFPSYFLFPGCTSPGDFWQQGTPFL
jgi:hypothetical protein